MTLLFYLSSKKTEAHKDQITCPKSHCWIRFMCPKHSGVKQTETGFKKSSTSISRSEMFFCLYIHLSACLLVRASWSGNFPTFLLLGPPVDVRGWSIPSKDLQRGLWAVSNDNFCHAFSDKIKLQFKGRLTHTHTLYQCSLLVFTLYQYYNDMKCK